MDSSGERGSKRLLAGLSVSLLGVGLLGVPAFDVWDDLTNLSWSLGATFVENSLFVVLAGTLVGGGVWLVRSDWATDRVVSVAQWTLGGTLVVALLMGWAVTIQLLVLDALKPWVLALDGALVGAVLSFGLAVTSVRARTFRETAAEERTLNEQFNRLYRSSVELERATTHEETTDIVLEAVDDTLEEGPFRVVVDGECLLERGAVESAVEQVPLGDRGHVAFGRPPADHEVTAVKLFGSYLEAVLGRIDRQRTIHDQRDALEFINRTIRHDLANDLSVVGARLAMLNEDASLDRESAEHLAVARDRLNESESFVQTVGSYVDSVTAEDRTLEPTPLEPVVERTVRSVRESYPEATVECAELPSVTVPADELFDRVFTNLFRNAVEHNDAPEPTVTVDAERDDGRVCLEVADNGPGIPESRREAVFERGEHGAESDGSGFGLYLVRDVVKEYGGSVSASANEPTGTVVELELPVAEEQANGDEVETLV